MDTACDGVAERILRHADFEKGLQPDELSAYYQEVQAWEQDPNSAPNPFDMTIATPSQCAVRKALSDEENAELAAGKNFSLCTDTSPSELITRGMDLESEM